MIKIDSHTGKRIFCAKDYRVDLAERPLVMGIVNVTPDSFSDGGATYTVVRAVEHALQLEKDGADIIDIGRESTRPGSDPVSMEEELYRVIPVSEALSTKIHIPI